MNNRKYGSIMHTFRVLVVVVLIFFAICYIYFAVIPEHTGFSFPTGGWDWLSFVGSLAGVIIASWGVAATIESSRIQAEDDAAKAVRPILNISVINHFKMEIPNLIQGIYLPYSVKNGTVRLEDDFYYLSNVDEVFPDESQCLLQIRNIGLGSAMNIRIKLYKIKSIADQNPENYALEDVETFYNSIQLDHKATPLILESNVQSKHNNIGTDVYYEFPSFHLNNSTDVFNFVFGQRSFSGTPAYYLLMITYTDTYEARKYLQQHHLKLDDKRCWYFSASRQISIPPSDK